MEMVPSYFIKRLKAYLHLSDQLLPHPAAVGLISCPPNHLSKKFSASPRLPVNPNDKSSTGHDMTKKGKGKGERGKGKGIQTPKFYLCKKRKISTEIACNVSAAGRSPV